MRCDGAAFCSVRVLVAGIDRSARLSVSPAIGPGLVLNAQIHILKGAHVNVAQGKKGRGRIGRVVGGRIGLGRGCASGVCSNGGRGHD